MRVKLALLDSDKSYLSRMSAMLMSKMADKLEVYSFTNAVVALSEIQKEHINVLVSSVEFHEELSKLNVDCGLAYFSDTIEVGKLYDKPAICKYQKLDDFYRSILNVYAESPNPVIMSDGNINGITAVFASPCGGTGTSSVAAAFAVHAASKGKKVIYINLERFGNSSVFFEGSGASDISDIIYSVKGKKANLRLKFESTLRNDKSNVLFFSSSNNALDIIELTKDETIYLIKELRASGLADYIVIDTDFGIDKEFISFINAANKMIWVSDGTEIANDKIQRAINAIAIIEKQTDSVVLEKTYIMYNRFSNKLGKLLADNRICYIGGAPKYEHAPVKAVVASLASNEAFDKLM